jgi:sugar phosphate isomerase/epimerase
VIGLHWLLAKTQGFHVTSPDADVRRRTSDYFGQLARLAAELGGKILVFGSPQQRSLLPGVSTEQAVGYAADVIQSALPVFEECDVVLALEPLGPQETNFLVTTGEAVALAGEKQAAKCSHA